MSEMETAARSTVRPARLLDVQRRYRELGRLRTGRQVPTGRGGTRPEKLATWRITSSSRRLLEAIAELYGGTVQEWKDAPNEGENYEVVTESDTLRVAIPEGSRMLSQFWELWSGGGCKKRCDGRYQILVDRQCSCPADIAERLEDKKACNAVTRLSVILPEVPEIGVWRLETHSYNAAEEIPPVFDMLSRLASEGKIVPALLRIEQRTAKKDGQTSRFAVPVLEVGQRPAEIASGIQDLAGERPQLEPGEVAGPPSLPPPTQRRSIPEAGAPAPEGHEVARAGFGEEAPAPSAAPPESGLPRWLVDIPDDDGTIVDAANRVMVRRKSTRKPIESVAELADAPVDFQEQLIAELDTARAETEGEAQAEEPESAEQETML